jgi:HEPN domain-containing protein
MNDETVAAWLLKLESDLKIARDESETQEPATDAVCFHCQQAVEKGLKALLISRNQEINRTHDLSLLLKLCGSIYGPMQELSGLDLDSLSRYAADIRYPDDFYMPDVEEMRQALALAQKVIVIIRGCLDGRNLPRGPEGAGSPT